MENLTIYKNLSQPPKDALKTIQAGRLKGKSDISPQWRIEAMTEQFGICGVGWRYEITKQWVEAGSENQVFAFTNVDVFVKVDGEWSYPIPGNGGSMLIVNEKNGIHNNDEAFKMSLTDALSVAMKSLGMAADIYRGFFDGSKYTNKPQEPQKATEFDEKHKQWAVAIASVKEGKYTVDEAIKMIKSKFTFSESNIKKFKDEI